MENRTYFEILQEVENEEIRYKILHNTLQDDGCKWTLKGKFAGLTHLLNAAFIWSSTKEGRDFWVDVAKNHRNKKFHIFDLLRGIKESKLQYEIFVNIVSQRSPNFDELTYLDVAAMISEGFTWSKTKQGHSYWDAVHKSFLISESEDAGVNPDRDDTGVSPEEQRSIIGMLEILSKL